MGTERTYDDQGATDAASPYPTADADRACSTLVLAACGGGDGEQGGATETTVEEMTERAGTTMEMTETTMDMTETTMDMTETTASG